METTIQVIVIILGIVCYFSKGETKTVSTLTCTATCPSEVTQDHDRSNKYNAMLIQRLIRITEKNTESIEHLKEIISKMQNKSQTAEDEDIDLPPPTSCEEIHERNLSCSSGYYQIITGDNETKSIYCHMENLCGSEGGWARLAFLDMTDSVQTCPGGLRLYNVNGVKACGRPSSSRGCHSVKYPSNGIKYEKMCGRIRGYQYGSPDAMQSRKEFDSYYVDGISLTRGSPREYIWTFAAGTKEDNSFNGGISACPCQIGTTQTDIPDFIGNDYFCESGNPVLPSGQWERVLYTDDPLWDGKMCRSLEEPCCRNSTLPWFNKKFNRATDDYIELRFCDDEGTSNEDTPIDQLEIYVK